MIFEVHRNDSDPTLNFYFLIFIIILQINCVKPKSKNIEILSLLSQPDSSPIAYFSYPGRYSDQNKKNEVQKKIIQIISETKSQLQIYAYSFNNPEIIEEILKAKKRGVVVKIILDKEKDFRELKEKNIEFSKWRSSGLHHLKVIVSDQSRVFFGTGNFSKYGLTQDYNGYIEFILEEKNISKFISMLDDTYENSIFNSGELFFITSPKDGRRIQSQILREIRNAKSTIHYLIFDHFDPIISHYLKEASSRGVEVIGVYDSQTDEEGLYLKDSFYGLLSQIYRDGNEDKTETDSFPEGGLLHHKTMIIDKKILLVGSYNYSSSARDNNREIFMQTENINLVKEFEKEFIRIKEKAYRENPVNFFSSKDYHDIHKENKEIQICMEGLDIKKPLIELGEGIFRTVLYYPNFSAGNCIEKNSFHGISSNFSYPKTNSFLELDEFWYGMKIFERESNRIFEEKITNEISIFQSNKIFTELKIDFFDITGDGKVIFRTNRGDSKNKKISIFFPGEKLRDATLHNYMSEENFFYGNLSPDAPKKGSGLAFIELQYEILFFCFQKEGDSKKTVIEEFLSEWTVDKSISGKSEIQKPTCNIY